MSLCQTCFDASDEGTLRREERVLDEARKELGFEGRLVTPESYCRKGVV